ncbi:MAG: chromosomal replication initiator protein DnaA [Helicobacteraceae bacterium]|jgi:chromosomal replication initiator protein|nr:chromosomal replication initiator protein DnaA [Helicobacteraceae bacterium]
MQYEIIKEELKNSINVEDYEKFIAPLKFLTSKSKSNEVIFEAQNPFLAAHAQRNFAEIIANVFEKVTKTRPIVQIVAKRGAIGGVSNAQTQKEKIDEKPKSHELHGGFTFEKFVVAKSNELAVTIAKVAARAIIEEKPAPYNPVLFFGGVGLGKTHLMVAVGNAAREKKVVVTYRRCEDMMNEFKRSIKEETLDRFRNQYRNCDLLLIDDIQFLSGKEGFQEEFFNTFEALAQKNKQIVLTCDQVPKMIAGLTERLKSRFMGGQIAEILPPELDTKINIIKLKLKDRQISMEDDVIRYIATKLDSNVREIESVLNQFVINMTIGNKNTIEIARDILKNYLKEKRENITIDEIVGVVARETNCKISEIRSKGRTAPIAKARKMVIFLARKLTKNSMPHIAEYFGMKDHSAASHAYKAAENLYETEADFKAKIEFLIGRITENHENQLS